MHYGVYDLLNCAFCKTYVDGLFTVKTSESCRATTFETVRCISAISTILAQSFSAFRLLLLTETAFIAERANTLKTVHLWKSMVKTWDYNEGPKVREMKGFLYLIM